MTLQKKLYYFMLYLPVSYGEHGARSPQSIGKKEGLRRKKDKEVEEGA